ncbi:MAG: hypothetical protein OQL27_10290 [Sedimenticola sp.]|nr:hypothetical protein [Sedimenticola sp.]
MKQIQLTACFLLLTSLSQLLIAADSSGLPRILFIDSYHEGYTWSDGVTQGVIQELEAQPVTLKIHRMDTKRNRDEAFKKAAALKALQIIKDFKPDVLIACDDNAAKYLIAPYLKEKQLPVIFCGVNWDASIYGFPTNNITGMIEVEMIEPLIQQLREYAKGDRIGYLGINSLSSEKVSQHYKKLFDLTFSKQYFVNDYSEWIETYLKLQDEVDILLVGNPQGLKGWDESDFIQIALKKTRIPSGTTASWRTRFTLMGYIRIAEEQGIWAAKSALRILNGTPPSAIPVTYNQQGKLILNLGIANALKITFNPVLIRHAEIIKPYSNKRILFIDSYHEGYDWSDGLLRGINKGLTFSGVTLHTFHLNSKLNPDISAINESVANAIIRINEFEPDVLIACDDNAMKHLILPHFKDTQLPVVFCGLNWDSSIYGLPFKNTTGMIELDAITEVLSQLRQYAKGERIGIIGVNRATARKNVTFIKHNLQIPIEKSYLVETFAEWKNAYSALQNEVDMVLAINHIGLPDWDQQAAEAHARAVIKIPVGAFAPWSMQHAVISFIKSPMEQGEWSARTALQIIDGTAPDTIPIIKNSQFELVINRTLLQQLNLVIDKALYSRARFIE